MSQFRIRNVILPAVLVASGVFSILTLPFVLSKSEPTGFALPEFLEESSQPVFDRDNKNIAIRYVGGAIVVSVGAGVATTEMLRRLHPANRLPKTPKDSLNAQIFQPMDEDQPNLILLSETTESSTLSPEPLLILPYETYRIKVPHRQHTLFAILLDGQYYSLVRTHKSREKVFQIASSLRQRGEEVVVTPIEDRHAVWILQPEAYSELVS
ncbi:MAG: hypothetical protein HC772_14245 [Leptolyngbyaceae cyanobacterium CRU_2_3]|nr:hypothetical protein [Leptolyngbyaceae cyanobacterium CRU_2_3]